MIEVVHAGNADDIQLVKGIANECIEKGESTLLLDSTFSIFLQILFFHIWSKILKNRIVSKREKIVSAIKVIVDFKIVINIL